MDLTHHTEFPYLLFPIEGIQKRTHPHFDRMFFFGKVQEPCMLAFPQTTLILYPSQPIHNLFTSILLTMNFAKPKSQTFTFIPSSMRTL